jgi:hypothetical protein
MCGRCSAYVGFKSFADRSSRHVIERWATAVMQVTRIPTDADASSVYEHNVDFWEALMTIAIQVAVTDESPTRWQLMKEATRHAVEELPNTLRRALGDLLGGILKKPLLYAGIGLGGIALVLLLIRSTKNETESRP